VKTQSDIREHPGSYDPAAAAGRGVLVIGAGVSGLTSALCLRRRGYSVTVVADRFAPRVTSVVAGALWEWPPAVCGHHRDLVSLRRSKVWCRTSFDIFGELAKRPETGIFVRPVTYYFKQPIEEDRLHRVKMVELSEFVGGFRHAAALIRENGVNPELGLRDAYTHLAPMVDTDVYMRWLLGEVRNEGCRILEHKISGPLSDQAEALARHFEVDAIVNCAGLGAGELAGEAMYPLRGALIRVRNDGIAMPRVTEAHCISHDDSETEPGFVFIVPRGLDMLVLGGLAEPDEWDLDIGLHNYEPVRQMLKRCVDFLPALRNAQIDAAEPVRVGLRPVREQNVRLELEAGPRVVHNYGHGGSGVTFSWGCAHEAADLVDSLR
jgi:D-amino-acid oxidase